MAKTPDVYRLSPLAVEDLQSIYLYTLQAWSRRQAELYISDLIAAFEGLAAGTKVGRKIDAADGYLKLPVGSHIVFFRIEADAFDIIRILHRAMDASRHLTP